MNKTCIDCDIELPLVTFNRNGGEAFRPECKACEKKRRVAKQSIDPFHYVVTNLADGILGRTKYKIDSEKNKTYKERGIKCLLGDTRAEVRESLIKYFSADIKEIMSNGEKPSIDRVNPYGNYEVSNIQVVTLKENLKRSSITNKAREVEVTYPQGNVVIFESVSDASRELGIKRDTIYWGANNPGGNKKGYEFKIG